LVGGRPTRIAIDHDDYHAEHVGHTADGRQSFLTTPFEPGTHGDDGQELGAGDELSGDVGADAGAVGQAA
jgi:hypothetical protein